MSRASLELDFLAMDKEASSKSHLHKRFHRQRSFRDIQSAISKINPDLLKSVIASGSGAAKISETGIAFKSFSVPSIPKEEHTPFPVLPVYSPMSRSALENAPKTGPLTIFYNGTVTVFDVPREKAETIMKFAEEGSNISLQPSDSSAGQQQMKMLESSFIRDLSIKRSVSLKRFLEKRKERSTDAFPYAFSPEPRF